MKSQPKHSWLNFFLPLFLTVYAYVFMEWLFTVTRPSFMAVIPWGEKIAVLLFSAGLLFLLAALLSLPLILLSALPWLRPYRGVLMRFAGLLPAGILAALGLLWLDNFLYTLFKFGIVTSDGVQRGVYALLFLFLWGLALRWVWNFLRRPPKFLAAEKGRRLIFAGLPLVVLLSLGSIWLGEGVETRQVEAAEHTNGVAHPHILLITSDGVNAANTSAYGYPRDTTPVLRQLAETSLLAENAFTNSGSTAGSVVAIYTGKYPTQTRLLYPPNILNGADAYQHLPGILKSQGYRTVQITSPYFVDAYSLNLLNGFDLANQRSFAESSFLPQLYRYLPNNYAYFLSASGGRLSDRLGHIFYLRRMENPYDLVTKPRAADDQQRLELLLNEVRRADAPLFVHVHFMGTHGALFRPQQRVFSTEANKKIPWDADGYDDSILEFDQQLGVLVALLEKRGLLDKTILVIGSDHGQRYVTNERLPLIIRFPNGQFAGHITANVQNMDIAPTLLDYLGLEQPAWMPGISLLGELPASRPIWSFAAPYAARGEVDGTYVLDESQMAPPFYQFGAAGLVDCQRWYKLDLLTLELTSGEVAGHTAPCPEAGLMSAEEFITALAEHLQAQGFDASSLITKP